MPSENPASQPSPDLGGPTATQLAFTVSGRSLFALTLGWEDRLAFIRTSRERAKAIGGPDCAAVSALDVAEITLQAAIDETRALMSASIPGATVGLS